MSYTFAPAFVFPNAASAHMPAHTMRDEESVLAAAARGETNAFRALYDTHRAEVARLVFRMLPAQSDHDDVVQEVFVQVFRSLKDFRGQSKFSTWLHRVTVNVVLMHRRSQKSRPHLSDEEVVEVRDEGASPPDDDAERRERMRAFGRILGRLSDKKRIAFVLHELEGLSPQEVANAMQCPVLTVRTRLFYARRELEAMMRDEPALAALNAGHAENES